MRLIAILFVLGILLFGCTQQADQGQVPNSAGNNVTPGAGQQPLSSPPVTTPADKLPQNKSPPSGMENVTAIFTIHIKDFAFEPSEVTVPNGAKVVWVNDDTVAHSINGGAAFTSPMIPGGGTYEHVFSEGTYSYVCGAHPTMHGKIIVVK